jgi:hypothetical protein
MIERSEAELAALEKNRSVARVSSPAGVRLIDQEPSDEELRAFVDSMLSSTGQLREPGLIDEAIREASGVVGVALDRPGLGFDVD